MLWADLSMGELLHSSYDITTFTRKLLEIIVVEVSGPCSELEAFALLLRASVDLAAPVKQRSCCSQLMNLILELSHKLQLLYTFCTVDSNLQRCAFEGVMWILGSIVTEFSETEILPAMSRGGDLCDLREEVGILHFGGNVAKRGLMQNFLGPISSKRDVPKAPSDHKVHTVYVRGFVTNVFHQIVPSLVVCFDEAATALEEVI